jgi:hypothetical protein
MSSTAFLVSLLHQDQHVLLFLLLLLLKDKPLTLHHNQEIFRLPHNIIL